MPKKKEKIDMLKDQDKIKELVRKYKAEQAEKKPTYTQSVEEFSVESREFKDFYAGQMESEKAHSMYEKLAKIGGKIIKMKVKEKDADKMGKQLYSIGYHITPADVMGLAILTLIIFVLIGGAFILKNYVISLVVIMIGLGMMMMIQKMPSFLAKAGKVETMNYMPLAVTYMVIFMRSTPTLEGAVDFAAKHLTGPLGRDLRALVWGLHNGHYMSMEQALKEYAETWKDDHKTFYESLNIIRDSGKIANEQDRLKMLGEATRVILQGNFDMMKDFARGLDMPIMVLYMLCIVLPVMGLVIAPIVTTVMSSGFNSNWLIVIYDIILPLIVYGVSKNILKSRPGSFNQPDIEGVEGIPKAGCMLIKSGIKEINLKVWPISVMMFIVISIPGIMMFVGGGGGGDFGLVPLIQSMTFIWGAAAGIAFYGWATSYQKIKIRKDLRDLEAGMNVALYELGNTLQMGTPVENAMASAADAVKSGAVHDMFTKASENITTYKMTLREAFFNKETGAMKNYPSKLVTTILDVLIESSKVGMQATSSAMITISSYLENLARIKESIKNLIGKTVGSMKFQAKFLTSFITGVIVALDVLLFKILSQLGSSMSDFSMPSEGVAGLGTTSIFKNSLFSVASVIPAHHMQLMVGVYMILTTVLLSMLINGTENGKDTVGRNKYIGKNIIIATIVYSAAAIIGTLVFTSFQV